MHPEGRERSHARLLHLTANGPQYDDVEPMALMARKTTVTIDVIARAMALDRWDRYATL